MGYDRGESYLFNSEPNGIPFGSKSKGKLSPRSYPIQFERKWNTSFLSVDVSLNFVQCSGNYARKKTNSRFWESRRSGSHPKKMIEQFAGFLHESFIANN